MHRLSNQTYVCMVKTRPLLLMLVSPGILVFVHVQLLMVLRMRYLEHSNWYHASKVHLLQLSIIWQTLLSHNSNPCICVSFQSKLLGHMQGEQILPMGVHETCPNPLHMVKILGQATWIQNDFNSYLCEMVVINYQKEKD